MNVPNLLTLLRIVLIPFFVIFIIDRHFDLALLTFAIAGITDGLDGFLARVKHQRTELGAYLDPLADKLLLTAAFISLAIIERIPSWLVVIVVSRDIIIPLGFLVMVLTSYRPKINPTFLSKVTTTFQILTVLLVLVAGDLSWFIPISIVAFYGTAAITILSGAQYIYNGTRMLNGKNKPPSSQVIHPGIEI